MNEQPAQTPKLTQYHNPTTGYKWKILTVHQPWEQNPTEIKVIQNPGVYLVSYSTLHEGNINEFLRDHQIRNFTPWGQSEDFPELVESGHSLRNARGQDSELLIELAGRICYMSYERPRPGGLRAFIDRLRGEGHGSVFEHPHYSFIVSGVSRNLSLEANRHRPFSISQLSGRFVDASEVGFVVDTDLSASEVAPWVEDCVTAFRSYQKAYERNFARRVARWKHENPGVTSYSKETERKMIKAARERARDILPGALETRVLYTVNARAIRFIIEKRCHADAAYEIRRCFNQVYRVLKAHDPLIFSDYREVALPDGTFAVSTDYGKI